MPMKHSAIQRRERSTTSMEKRVLRDNSRASKVEVASILKTSSLSSSEAVDTVVVAISSSTSSSTLDSNNKVINNSTSSIRKIFLRIQMLSNLTSSRYSSSTEEERSGSFSSTKPMTRKART